jgi:hypothetical protein
MDTRYRVAVTNLQRSATGQRLMLNIGAVIKASMLTEVGLKDALAHGFIEEIDGSGLDPDALRALHAPTSIAVPAPSVTVLAPSVVTKTHEGLDPDALRALDPDSLFVAVIERLKEQDAGKAVVQAIRDMPDPKESAISFLTASLGEQDEFVATVRAAAAEAAALPAELPPMPEDRLGRKE